MQSKELYLICPISFFIVTVGRKDKWKTEGCPEEEKPLTDTAW